VLYKKEDKKQQQAAATAADQGAAVTAGNNLETFHLLEAGASGKRAKGASYKYEVAFDNICSQEEEYTVTISTELNGRTVTQMVEKFPMGAPPSSNGSAAAVVANCSSSAAAAGEGSASAT
jgi:hypothetical protein